MSITKVDYENLLAQCSDRESIVALLRNHRDYIEMIPSLRRPKDSIITIPLPLAKIRDASISSVNSLADIRNSNEEITSIPCDIAILMCDPEWKIKMGVEILIFIHRPQEDFSDLLGRWRRSQICLSKEYEWVMPTSEDHMFSDVAEQILPLFILFPQTPERIQKGLQGSGLPYIEYSASPSEEEEKLTSLTNQSDNN